MNTKQPNTYKTRNASNNTVRNRVSLSASDENLDYGQVLLSIQNELKEMRKQNKKCFDDLKHSVEDVSKKVSELSSKIDDLEAEQENIVAAQEKLEEENENLRNQIDFLDDRVNDIEQYSRKYNLELDGVPETPEENMELILQALAKALQITYNSAEINVCHRVPTKNPKKTKPIIIAFRSYPEKEKWLNAYRNVCRTEILNEDNSKSIQWKSLSTKQINQHLAEGQVYLREHLTTFNKQLLYDVKTKAKEKHYAVVRVKDGKILVKKNVIDKKFTRVRNLKEIERFII